MNSYFPLVDILRFLAAFAVVCFHYFSSSLHGKYDPFSIFSNYGMLGVQLFFIISGFVIFFSLNRSIKEYALGRFLRLYPLFWVLCTITYIATLVSINGSPLPFHLYLYNLLIVNTGKTALMIDGSYWTLTIEILFYFLIGLFVFIFGMKRLLTFYLGWLLLTLTAFYFGFYHLLFMKILLVRQAPYFIFGGLIAYFYSNRLVSTTKEKIITISGIIISAATPFYISSVLSSDSNNRTNFFGIYDTTAQVLILLLFLFFPCVIYVSKYIHNEKLFSVAKKLGIITYPLYLLHQKLGSLVLGSTFGTITLYSLLTVLGMIIFSYNIGMQEEVWRKKIYKKLMIKIGLTTPKNV